MTAFLVGIGLTQIGEFSFVLVQVAKAAGHIGSEVYNATLAASVITIFINAALVRYVPNWIGRKRLVHDQHDQAPWPQEGEPLQQHVVLCGFGRVGSSLGRALETFNLPYVAIDRNPDIIRRLQVRGVACLYKVPILARAHGPAEAERLGVLGATEVIQPEVEASATLIRHALTWFGVPKVRMLDYVEQYRQSMETKRQSS